MSLEILVLQALKKVNPPTRQIVNGASKNGLRVVDLNIGYAAGAVERVSKPVLSGVVAANTPKSLLEISGAGELNFLALTQTYQNGCALTVRVVIDGVAAYETTLAYQSFQQYMLPIVGTISGDKGSSGEKHVFAYDHVRFTSSLKIEIVQSIALNDEFSAFLAYKTY